MKRRRRHHHHQIIIIGSRQSGISAALYQNIMHKIWKYEKRGVNITCKSIISRSGGVKRKRKKEEGGKIIMVIKRQRLIKQCSGGIAIYGLRAYMPLQANHQHGYNRLSKYINISIYVVSALMLKNQPEEGMAVVLLLEEKKKTNSISSAPENHGMCISIYAHGCSVTPLYIRREEAKKAENGLLSCLPGKLKISGRSVS